MTKCTDLIEKYELTHLAKVIENKISDVVDVFKLVDLIKLNKFISSKTFAVDKSTRLKKSFASSFKRSRDRSLKRLQSKKKHRSHESRQQFKIILSSSNNHYYHEETYIEFEIVNEYQEIS